MMRRSRMLSCEWAAACVAGVAVLCGTSGARAAGVEDTVTGTVAIGRSANYVRADDFMAVWQNPANLALTARKDVGLELRIPMFSGCFQRQSDPSKNYRDTELSVSGSGTFDKSCNSASVMPAGNLGFSMPLPRGFGFGIGVFTPGGVPKLSFGNDSINTVRADEGQMQTPTSNVRESPGRYMLIDKSVNAAFLMLGAGYQPMKQLRFGLSIGTGIVNVGFKNVTSLLGGSFEDQEIISDIHVTDAFVPRTTLSVASTPLDSVDLMASFTWNDDVKAKGDLDVTGNGFTTAPRGDCGAAMPGPSCTVKDVTLNIPYQRFEVVLGARYAQRRKPRERALEPMRDEVWDVEVNAYWSQTSHVDNYTLNIWKGLPNSPEQRNIQLSTAANAQVNPLPQNATLFHGWRDTYGVRVGGDYNVIPALLALRAGLGFETSAVPAKNMNIDYWPVQKVALSLGATLKLATWRLSVAYAHVFNETVNTPVGQGRVQEVVAIRQDSADAVNEGRYTSQVNVVSLQANYAF